MVGKLHDWRQFHDCLKKIFTQNARQFPIFLFILE
jgi:hypothetical protein